MCIRDRFHLWRQPGGLRRCQCGGGSDGSELPGQCQRDDIGLEVVAVSYTHLINATDCADYLTKKGMPFRDAYKLTGCMVSDCIAKDKTCLLYTSRCV